MQQLQIYIKECKFFSLNDKDEMPLILFFSVFQKHTTQLVTVQLELESIEQVPELIVELSSIKTT